ncbi:MAG TPA: endonuclease/exonuclease/phosphatase family protein [Pyrinomonadaceae bacterium]|nr:endonuclease/exonuclease/phosphatase family protein [Pyrinomonadaceae bacterium]
MLKLLSYNIRFGGKGRESKIAEVINAVKPDIVVFQEAYSPLVIERISAETEMPIFGARQAHSVAFISRVPVENHQWHHPAGSLHSFLEIQLAGSESRIFGLHLKPRFSKWSEAKRAREIRALLNGIKEHQHGFHLIVGDFNTLAPGERFQLKKMPRWIRALIWISGRDIKRETIQIMLDSGYIDSFRHLYPEVIGHTFPVWEPHVRLDYVFLPARYTEQLDSVEIIKQPAIVTTASDHFPLLANVQTA